jgi:pimeloyl-ACP methyl ester carboxylesterase
VSAREGLLRAYTYFRAASRFLSPRRDPRYRPSYERGRAGFRRATELFDTPPVELQIRYAGHALPGYAFVPAGGPSEKTLLMIAGGDTFVEDLYFYIVPSALKRAYNVAIVDLPGQGALPFDGPVMSAQAEKQVGAVVDSLGEYAALPLSKLGIFGISGGGYLAPRAASHDRRFKALVACGRSTTPKAVSWSHPGTRGRTPMPWART